MKKVWVHSTTGRIHRRAGIVFDVEPKELIVLDAGKTSAKANEITPAQYEEIKQAAGLNQLGGRGALAVSGDDGFMSALEKSKADIKKKQAEVEKQRKRAGAMEGEL